MRSYWIEIVTPKGKLELWNFNGAPIEQFNIAKALGYPVAYGQEGKRASKSANKWVDESLALTKEPVA